MSGNGYGNMMNDVEVVRTRAEAIAVIEKWTLINSVEYGQTLEQARSMLLSNIRYMAGYYSEGTERRIKRLFSDTNQLQLIESRLAEIGELIEALESERQTLIKEGMDLQKERLS